MGMFRKFIGLMLWFFAIIGMVTTIRFVFGVISRGITS